MATYTYKHYTYSKTYPAATWYMEVTESDINKSKNTSKITVKFYVKATHNKTRSDTYNNYPAGYGSNTPYSRFYIDGVKMKEVKPANFDCRYNSSKKIANGTKYNLGTYSQTITHNSNGAKSVTITCVHHTSVSPQEVKLTTGKISLTKINQNRVTTLTVPSGKHNIGNSITVQANPCNNWFKHILWVSHDNNTWIKLKEGFTLSNVNANNNIKFTIPNDFKKYIPAKSEGKMWVRLDTYNGSSRVGYENKTVKIYNNADKTNGSFTLSSKMPKTDGKYIFNKDSKIITDLSVTYDYVPHTLSYTITGPNGYSYSTYFNPVNDWAGQQHRYLGWPNKPGATGTHTFTSPVVPYKGTYTITALLEDGRYIGKGDGPTKEGAGQFEKSISVTFEEPAKQEQPKPTLKLEIKEFAIHDSTYSDNGIYIVGKTNPKVSLTFYTDYEIKSIEFVMSGANSSTRSINACNFVPGTTGKTTAEMGIIKNAGSNTIKATITAVGGKTASATLTFTGREEQKYLSIQDSYIDTSLSRDMVNGKYYKDKSRLGIKIKISNTHALSSMSAKIGSNSYNLNSYMYNNASYTCPDKLTQSGSVTVQLTAKDINGLTDTKIMYVTVDEEQNPPSVPKIEYEHKSNNYTPLSEGEKIVFTGTSDNINDYQIIYALASCDVFKATANYTTSSSYNGADPADLSSKLHNNTSSSIRYYIYKDFGENYKPITQDGSNRKKFHIHPTSPNHSTNDKYYALQWFEHAKPGDMVYVYVRERAKKTSGDGYLYSDSYGSHNIPQNKLFAMCVIPPCPGKIEIRKLEQTNEKFTIVYPNPVYNLNLGDKNPIHLIDVCLIAKDNSGNIINKSSLKRRDGMNGKTFFYYSERKWHNVVPASLSSTNNVKEFTMDFDISKYPKGTNISIIAFYYSDYYMHPSIYSTSNVIVTQRQSLGFDLSFVSPLNNAIVSDPNPTINLKVTAKKVTSGAVESPIYENVNFATSWNKSKWDSTPIWFRCPRSQDSQLPSFKKADVYSKNNYYTMTEDYPKHKVEHYNSQKSIYSGTFKPSSGSTSNSSLYKENCLFLQSGKNLIDLGDIMTNELNNNGSKTYTWKQSSGKFLKPGLNTIEAFTCPYNYEQCMFSIEEKNGYWLTDTVFVSNSIMPYNYYKSSIIRPNNVSSWADVESEILFIEIPYKYLSSDNKYSITFTSNVNNGFKYDDSTTYQTTSTYDSNDPALTKVCKSYMFINLHDASTLKLKNVSYTKNNIIYSPKYTITDKGQTVSGVNNYGKDINHTISFTAPSNTSSMSDSQKFILEIRVRGIDKINLSKITLNNLSSSRSESLTSKREIDSQTKENKISINVSLTSSNIDYGYINPLMYDDQMALRDYLLGIASQYNVTTKPKWRTLKRDSSYLQARDFNDVKDFCYDLFSIIKTHYSNIFTGNPDLFKNLPTIVAGDDKRGPTTYSSKGKHYFPEWDNLIDAIKKQTFSGNSSGSGSGATPTPPTPTPTPTTYYNISYYLIGGYASDTRKTIEKGKSFYTTIITTQSTLSFTSASVTMGGLNVSSNYLTITKSKITINIPSVTGDIHIYAKTSSDNSGSKPITTVTSLTCNSSTLISPGRAVNANVQVVPAEYIDSVTCESTNESVALVYRTNDDFYIKGGNTGSCTVTFRCKGKVATCKVTVAGGQIITHNISYYLVGGVSSDTRKTIVHGEPFNAVVTATKSTLHFISASVTMGGSNVSSNCLTMTNNKVTINIPSVTGNIYIDARTSDGWPITYDCGGYITFSNKQTSAKHRSLFETYIYWKTKPSTFIVTMGGENITHLIGTYPNMNAYFMSVSQVTGPIVIKVW